MLHRSGVAIATALAARASGLPPPAAGGREQGQQGDAPFRDGEGTDAEEPGIDDEHRRAAAAGEKAGRASQSGDKERPARRPGRCCGGAAGEKAAERPERKGNAESVGKAKEDVAVGKVAGQGRRRPASWSAQKEHVHGVQGEDGGKGCGGENIFHRLPTVTGSTSLAVQLTMSVSASWEWGMVST